MRKLRNFRIDHLHIILAMLTFPKFKSQVFIFLLNSRQTRLASYSTSVLKYSIHKTKMVTRLSKHPHDNFHTSPQKSQYLSYQGMATIICPVTQTNNDRILLNLPFTLPLHPSCMSLNKTVPLNRTKTIPTIHGTAIITQCVN